MSPDRVLIHWACTKIKHSDNLTDEQLGELIIKKINTCPNMSFKEIAMTAFRHGRRPLATMVRENISTYIQL
jgi:hypothetical protein